MTLLTAMYTTFNSTEAFLNSDRPKIFFFVVVVVFCFFVSLNNTLLHIYIQRKNYKNCKRN